MKYFRPPPKNRRLRILFYPSRGFMLRFCRGIRPDEFMLFVRLGVFGFNVYWRHRRLNDSFHRFCAGVVLTALEQRWFPPAYDLGEDGKE